MHPLITSHQNPKIKNLVSLEKARERKNQQLFVFEGLKELSLAVQAGYRLQSVFFCPQIIGEEKLFSIIKKEGLLIPVDKTVFEKLAYRESTGGIVATAAMREHTLQQVELSDNPLLLIVEGVEKPGNLGALLRTADAANADAVIICDPQTDFYNANVIRSSVGCVFTKQVASATSEETIAWLKNNNIQILCTYLGASKPYYEVDMKGPTAIVMGTESTGLSDLWVNHSNQNIIIPMQGMIDSMNVSTAAAVVIFEVKRQRNFS